MTTSERFWACVAKSDAGCWTWTGTRDRKGYGRLYANRRLRGAHRISYEIANGVQLADDVLVLHKCDNPPCVNPEHLRIGTNNDNVADRNTKRRHAHGENHASAKLTAQHVIVIRASTAPSMDLARYLRRHRSVDSEHSQPQDMEAR